MNIERHMAETMENDSIRADEQLLIGLLSACNPVKRGAGYKCKCPVHAERTPSCEVRRGRDGAWRWHCFGCGKKGDAFDLVVMTEGVTFRQARERLGARKACAVVPPVNNKPEKRHRAGDPPPTHVLACERRACTGQQLVNLLEVAVMLDSGEVTRSQDGETRWVCRACVHELERNRRYWALWRLRFAPRRERLAQQQRSAA